MTTAVDSDGGFPGSTSRFHILALLLVLSLSALVQTTAVSQTNVISPLRADASEYFSYAFNLSEYGVYSIAPSWNHLARPPPPAPDDLRPPGYPLFLEALGPPEPSMEFVNRVLYAQAALGVLSVLLTYLVAARVSSRGAALGVALVAATTPHLATISTYLLSESLFFFLLMVSVYTLILAATSQRRWLYAASGVAWGLCSLVRLTTLYLPVLLLVAILILPKLRAYRGNALVGIACFLIVLSPWAIRNQQSSVDRVQSGLMVKTLLHGSYPDFTFEGRPETFGFPYRFDPDAERISRDLPSILGHIASQFKTHPLAYARWYLIGKPIYFLSWGGVQAVDILIYPVTRTPFYDRPLFRGMRAASHWLHWPLMISGVLGALLVFLRPNWLALDATQLRAASIVAAVVAYALVFHVVAAPIPRYSIPFRALIFTLAVLPWRAIALRGPALPALMARPIGVQRSE